jgi:hypothetical protein
VGRFSLTNSCARTQLLKALLDVGHDCDMGGIGREVRLEYAKRTRSGAGGCRRGPPLAN